MFLSLLQLRSIPIKVISGQQPHLYNKDVFHEVLIFTVFIFSDTVTEKCPSRAAMCEKGSSAEIVFIGGNWQNVPFTIRQNLYQFNLNISDTISASIGDIRHPLRHPLKMEARNVTETLDTTYIYYGQSPKITLSLHTMHI